MGTVTIEDWNGQPLPDGHPFKGTRIIYGVKRPAASGTPSAPEASGSASPDPMQDVADRLELAAQQLTRERNPGMDTPVPSTASEPPTRSEP